MKQDIEDRIKGTSGSSVWATITKPCSPQNNPTTLLSEKINRHKLGANASTDVTVYEEKDPSNYIGVSKTKSGKFIFISSQATLSTEKLLLNQMSLKQPSTFTRLKKYIQRRPSGDKFYITTNLDAKISG